MKIEDKLIQNVRINPERSLKLRKAVKRIEKETGSRIRESDLVNFLIDEGISRIKVNKDTLKII